MKMSDFVPETYRIDQVRDREQFLEIYKGMYNIAAPMHTITSTIKNEGLVVIVYVNVGA